MRATSWRGSCATISAARPSRTWRLARSGSEHVPALALRISYAGELGWELYVPTEYGRWLWDRLAEAGEPDGAVAVGLGAFESLRIEKGYRFAGVDMHPSYSADEAGLGFTVHLTQAVLHGREARAAAREAGPAAAGADRAGRPRRPPLGGEPVLVDGVPVGRVTSADFGASVGRASRTASCRPRWPSRGRGSRRGCSTASSAAWSPASRAGTRAASACAADRAGAMADQPLHPETIAVVAGRPIGRRARR